MLAVGILLLSSIVAINLLLEDSPVVIQLEGDTFKVVDIPYVYTVKEAYILLFSGFFGGLALAQVLLSLGLQGSAFPGTGICSTGNGSQYYSRENSWKEDFRRSPSRMPLLRNSGLPELTLTLQMSFCGPLKEMKEKLLN